MFINIGPGRYPAFVLS
uniref:Uncharacterized protein n=1 Tax=Mola mola TaxID=94237 RepID=A0A3Q3VWF6_MOLML